VTNRERSAKLLAQHDDFILYQRGTVNAEHRQREL